MKSKNTSEKALFGAPDNGRTPFLFTSKFLRLSKLHNLAISSTTPSFSSSSVKGTPKNSASFFKLKTISSFRSSNFKNSTLSGLSELAFQYPSTLSQKGP
uniref:Uncharacterized protein n=1 Tax=Salix viminalis TaxID=40686 RepID=A0A6N2MMI6_SALVM